MAAPWPRTAAEVAAQIASRTIKDDSGCWLWQGCRGTKGYGLIRFQRRLQRVHRVAWQVIHGPIPWSLFVCHRCDVRVCVRPEHLFLGTHEDNQRDKAEKLRARSNPKKLTVEKVREIRRQLAEGRRVMELAAEYGVGDGRIRAIRRFEIWRYA